MAAPSSFNSFLAPPQCPPQPISKQSKCPPAPSLHPATAPHQQPHSPHNVAAAPATRIDSRALGILRKFSLRRSHGDSTSCKNSTLFGPAVSASTSCILSSPP